MSSKGLNGFNLNVRPTFPSIRQITSSTMLVLAPDWEVFIFKGRLASCTLHFAPMTQLHRNLFHFKVGNFYTVTAFTNLVKLRIQVIGTVQSSESFKY